MDSVRSAQSSQICFYKSWESLDRVHCINYH